MNLFTFESFNSVENYKPLTVTLNIKPKLMEHSLKEFVIFLLSNIFDIYLI